MSFTGLKTGNFTDINLDGELRVGNDLETGTSGQVLQSQGETLSVVWANPTSTAVPNPLTMGTNITLTSGNATWDGSIADTINATDTNTQLNLTGGNGIDIQNTGGLNRTITTDNDGTTINNSGGTGTQNQVLKVPNTLTITDSAGTSIIYDGSITRSITINDNDNQLNLTEGNGITITNTGGLNRTIALNADGTTLSNNVGSGQAGVLKVPNSLSAGTNLNYSSGTTFDGSSARTINLNASLTNIDSITFTSTSGTTALTGNDYHSNPTPMTNFDLSDTSNIISPYFFHDIYDPASLDTDSLTTSYANIFSNNLFNSFTAKQTSCAIELRVYNAQFSTSGRSTYARLNGSSSTSSSAEFTTLYSTSGRNTTRLFHQADESDDVYTTMTWVLTGLTIGNSYNLYPQMRSSTTSNSIYAGGSYPGAILRGYYLPSTGI